MAKELLMPKLGLTMEEGTLIEWYIKEGDSFKTGDLIFAVETEKLTNDVEANEDGEILEILVHEGETVDVKTPVARLVGYQEESPAATEEIEAEKSETEVKKEKKDDKKPEKKTAKKESSRKVMAAPKTRKFADDNDVKLAVVAEFVDKNKIVVSDIEEYLEKREAEKSAPTEKRSSSSMRKIIGERLTESWKAPHIYLKKEVNAEALMNLKETFKNRASNVSLNDILSFITAKAIKNYKKINSLEKDTGEFEVAADINLGLAVAVKDGLLVPVLENADTLSLKELAEKSKDLISRTKENKLNPDEMHGGTFTITNLGMFGIDEFTAILNPPQAAILTVGTIKEKLYLEADSEVYSKKVVNLTLGVDHRAIDGATAAKFMQVLTDYIENPYLCF
jgi:pyruvate dehydrogenase E2 component (dihydrolipoamide acetyltransferase)